MLSIEQSREVLGEEYSKYSDDEIEKIRDGAYMFADIFLEGVVNAREVLTDTDNKTTNNKK